MNEHTVKSYEDEFKLLDRRIAQMGGYAEKLLVQAMDALERRDPKLAENAVASDEMVDQLERELQDQVIVDDRQAAAARQRSPSHHDGR